MLWAAAGLACADYTIVETRHSDVLTGRDACGARYWTTFEALGVCADGKMLTQLNATAVKRVYSGAVGCVTPSHTEVRVFGACEGSVESRTKTLVSSNAAGFAVRTGYADGSCDPAQVTSGPAFFPLGLCYQPDSVQLYSLLSVSGATLTYYYHAPTGCPAEKSYALNTYTYTVGDCAMDALTKRWTRWALFNSTASAAAPGHVPFSAALLAALAVGAALLGRA